MKFVPLSEARPLPVSELEAEQPKQLKFYPLEPTPSLEQETSYADIGRNLLASALKIGPTAVKGLAELGSMATGDKFDFGVAKRMQEGMQAIDEVIGSEKFNAQQKAFAQIIADDTKSVGDMIAFLAENPAVLVDQGITTIGSMFLPVGAAGAAAKGAKALKASKAAAEKAMVATTIGTSAAQNAASTFAELEDKPLEDRYAGAAVTGAVSMLAGIAAKGGAEGALARKLADDLSAGKIGLNKVASILKGGVKEAGQEVAEEAGGAAGEVVGGEAPTLEEVAKRATIAGIIGGGLGAGVEALPSGRPVAPTEQPPPPTAERAEPDLGAIDTTELEPAKKAELDLLTEEAIRAGIHPRDAVFVAARRLAARPAPVTEAAPSVPREEAATTQEAPPAQAQDVGEPVGGGVGVSPTVSVPATEPAAPGAIEESERLGVVRAGEAAGEISGAAGSEPTALEPTTEAPTPADPYTDLAQKVRVGEIKPTVPAVKAALGVKTPAEARTVLERMETDGIIESKGKGKGYKLALAPAPAPAPAPTEVIAEPAPVEPAKAEEAPTEPFDANDYAMRSAEEAIAKRADYGDITNATDAYLANLRTTMEERGVTDPKVIEQTEQAFTAEVERKRNELLAPKVVSYTDEDNKLYKKALNRIYHKDEGKRVAPTKAAIAKALKVNQKTAQGLMGRLVADGILGAQAKPGAPRARNARPETIASLVKPKTEEQIAAEKNRVRKTALRQHLMQAGEDQVDTYLEWVAQGLESVPTGTQEPTTISQLEAAAEPKLRTQEELDAAVAIAEEKVRISADAEQRAKAVGMMQALRDPRLIWPRVKTLWASLTDKQRRAMLSVSTTDFVAYGGGEEVPELRRTNTLLQEKAGLTEQLLAGGSDMVAMIHRAFTADPKLKAKVEAVVYTATLSQYDPADPSIKARNKKLDDKFAALGKDGQALYVRVRDYYDTMAEYYGQLLDDQINALALAPESKQAILAKLRKMYEADKRIRPYFPLVRRGDYWLGVGSGQNREFYMFESMEERDNEAMYIAQQRHPGMPPEAALKKLKESSDVTMGNNIATLREKSLTRGPDGVDPSSLLRDIFDAIDNTQDADANLKETIKDDIYQLYLQTMPEQSFRKQFIARKERTGFRLDLVQNTAQTASRMANQLPRLKYASMLRNSLAQARASIEGRPELEPFVDEMDARVRSELSPPPQNAATKTADFINRWSFVWYMSSWASALVQPLSVFTTGLPVLSAKHGSAAFAQLGRNMKFWNTFGTQRENADGTKSFFASIQTAKNLTPVQKKAIQEMMHRKVAQTTYASEVYGYRDIPSEEYGSAGQKAKRGMDLLIGGLMHSTERISREIMYLTSFDLNYAKFKKAGKPEAEAFADAVDQAVLDTTEALNDYSAHNRPPVMKGPIGRIALQFKMYPLHMLLYLLKNFKGMLPGLNAEGKKEAAAKFFGTLGMTTLVAGVSGLPMFSVAMSALGAAWKGMGDDDDELPDDMRDVHFETWFRTVFLPNLLGDVKVGGYDLDVLDDLADRGLLNLLTGADIAGRAGLNDMLIRDVKETPTVQAELMEYAMQLAGPAIGMATSWARALDAFSVGDYQKGVESLSPAIMRSLVVTNKYRTEGFKDSSGAVVLDPMDIRTGELIVQGIGFRPDIVSNLQTQAFKLSAVEQKIKNARNKLLDRLNIAAGKEDDSFDNVIDDIIEFSRRYPTFAIDGETINKSLRGREEKKAQSVAGVRLTKENVSILDDALKTLEGIIAKRKAETEADLVVTKGK